MVRRSPGILRGRKTLLLVLILAAGAALRLYGLDWDGGQWLHPDERQIYFTAAGLAWPDCLSQALSPDSPLNPRFFAYGSFPLYLLRIAAALVAPLWPETRDFDNLHLVGRPLATVLDLGTVALTYRLARILWLGRGGGATGLLAAALMSLAVLPVQLAHFYTVDTVLTFLVMVTLNLAASVLYSGGLRPSAALGLAFGLALAAKVTAALLLFPVSYALIKGTTGNRLSQIVAAIVGIGVAFVLAQPYALIDWQTFLADTVRESQIAWGQLDVPYTRQYAGTVPYLYPAWQMPLWGLGLPLGLGGWAGLLAIGVRWLRRGEPGEGLLLAWAGPFLALTGALYAKYPRYLLPLVPVLCLVAAWLVTARPPLIPACGRASLQAGGRRDASRKPLFERGGTGAWIVGIGRWGPVVFSLVYVGMFEQIYAEPHSWAAASAWIYEEVPAGSTLAVEDWDAALPLPMELEGRSRRIEEYQVRTLRVYDEPDDAAKWEALARELAASDYVVIASRRAYGALWRLAERYPLAGRYYERLFAGRLGFEQAEEFTRGPGWLNPPVAPRPGAAPRWLLPDESLVVYDHPRVLVFRNVERLGAEALMAQLRP